MEKWSDLFSRTLSATPADLPPLVIDVDATRWMTKTSQGPPRLMSATKEKHVKAFVEEGLAQRIIRPSTQAHYSQVHLVPKPAGVT